MTSLLVFMRRLARATQRISRLISGHSGIQLAQDATIAQHDAPRTWQSNGAVAYKLRHGAGNGLDGEPKVVGNVLARHRKLYHFRIA